MTFTTAIIVAAGSGTRMGGMLPKQFLTFKNKPILQHTLERFQSFSEIDSICVVLPPDFVAEYERIIVRDWNISKANCVVAGGGERHLSVWAGIQAVSSETDIIMIHDGVRPFVDERIINESINAALQHGAAVVCKTPKDTVKQRNGNVIHHTLNRETIVLAQTPQTFQKDVILKANEFAFAHNTFSTDDAALVENMGAPVAIVEGDWKNSKITSPEDLLIANAILESEN